MNLQIRDPRAHDLARTIAEARRTSMTDAVITALEAEVNRIRRAEPLAARLARISEDLAGLRRAGGRDLTKDEIDALWGHD